MYIPLAHLLHTANFLLEMAQRNNFPIVHVRLPAHDARLAVYRGEAGDHARARHHRVLAHAGLAVLAVERQHEGLDYLRAATQSG